MPIPFAVSRREFLQRAGALGLSGIAAPLGLSLASLGHAAALTQPNDYKAIVCVFLYGGNDPYNTIVPYDAAGYRAYRTARTDIALTRESLHATALPANDNQVGTQFALAPGLSALKPLYDQGKLAILLNIGPLIVPTTKAQYLGAQVPLPPKLFSHNDQQSYWQALAPEGAASGWAGRMADLFATANSNSSFTTVTAGGTAVFLAGHAVTGYRVGVNGSTRIELLEQDLYGSSRCTALLRELITQPRPHLMGQQLAHVATRSIQADLQLRKALNDINIPGNFATPLAEQFKIVARMIAARDSLGAKRQVFFVSQNGYDNHSGLNDTHPALLRELGDAMSIFQSALNQLGVADQVSTFTASEFGRTLGSNGNGSDHGWGSHHFVMGGAVRGGKLYGSHPEIAVNGPGFVDNGRLLPTLAVEQLGGALGTWFGASRADLELVFPNLRNFGSEPLGVL